ncbi:amidohydrolase family protein [Limoniibacter endophyticus]|uniref:D-galactarolactone isomerase n=1 Tax=Limoniibacter endophyticus TaxID=1565040 RepID=A0A8J3DIP4_9HYPH|nr:amidohydrolase family protein [Limoniibacter endophyticus]GHC72025.1 D-galactarolactone isomerase [Limoniibacter endophyticus]
MTIKRKLTGAPPRTKLPHGTVDTQMHMYLPGFEAQEGGPPLPGGALPDATQYRRFMKWIGIDRVVITQGNAHQFDNRNLVACLQEMGDVAKGVAAIGPDTTDAELKELADAGVVGARIMDLPGGAIGLSELEGVADRALALGWMMTVQFNGSDLLEHLPRLGTLKTKWVFDHHGKFFDGVTDAHVAALKKLIDQGNVWFKFAGCYESSKSGAPDYEDIAAVAREIAAHAPERIIWGTNWPHNMAKTTEEYPDDAALADTVLGWFPDEHARHRALVENPQELFGFSPL